MARNVCYSKGDSATRQWDDIVVVAPNLFRRYHSPVY